jgi:hypothetical protein
MERDPNSQPDERYGRNNSGERNDSGPAEAGHYGTN